MMQSSSVRVSSVFNSNYVRLLKIEKLVYFSRRLVFREDDYDFVIAVEQTTILATESRQQSRRWPGTRIYRYLIEL